VNDDCRWSIITGGTTFSSSPVTHHALPLTLLDQGVTILTASRRLAHSLRLRYAQHAQGKGLSVWRTPQVLPWPAWLRQQWLQSRAEAPEEGPERQLELPLPTVATRLLTTAQTRVLWDDIVASSPLASDLLNPSSAAQIAARSWQRMQDYLIPLEALADTQSMEAQAMHSWATEFVERCDALDAIDEARLAGWAHAAKLVPATAVAFAGFDLMTPAINRLADFWRTQNALVELPAAADTAAEVSVVNAPDAQRELELAARWSRALLESRGANVGIVVGDLQQRRSEIRRVFEDVFAPGGRTAGVAATPIPVVIAAPEPLTAYPMVDAALLCLQLMSGGARSTVAGRILRSPFLAGGETERDARALADFRLRDEQRDQWDWFELERWAGITGCRQLQVAARAMSAILRAGMPKAAPSVWAERFHRALRAIGWPGERSLSSVEHQTLVKFQAALAEFGALDAVLGPVTLSNAIARLKELLQETAFEPEAEAAAVTVIDATTVAGMLFDAVWVTGLDATKLPPPSNPDPFIPLAIQRAAGVPEASPEGVFKLATVRLQRLISSAGSVKLSWPELDGDALLQASPLLHAWPQQHYDELTVAQTRSLRTSLFEARPLLATILDEQAPQVAAAQTTGGAMILELQSRCPFRSQAQLRLHAQPIPRVSLGLEPRDRGTLLHRVLADIWGELREQRVLLEMDDLDLALRIRTFAEQQAARTLRPSTRLRSRLAAMEIESVVIQIMGLMALERERTPFVVHLAEQGERFSIGGLQIRLQADRIDELQDGGQLLLDYKLGDSHKPRQWLDTWPGRPRRPQLPLYALAHAQRASGLAFVVLAPRTIEFRGWSRDLGVAPGISAYPQKRLPPDAPSDWAALMQHWHYTLTQLATGFVAGHALVDPLPQECETCHLSSFCRIHERALLTDAAEGAIDE
jgi:probable DNA repair protein